MMAVLLINELSETVGLSDCGSPRTTLALIIKYLTGRNLHAYLEGLAHQYSSFFPDGVPAEIELFYRIISGNTFTQVRGSVFTYTIVAEVQRYYVFISFYTWGDVLGVFIVEVVNCNKIGGKYSIELKEIAQVERMSARLPTERIREPTSQRARKPIREPENSPQTEDS